ncbi:MAG: hypothetical protein A3B91_03565 [Candidatus Yanofskybacteria bacterium RIFCSPHIGHO2_02_FULL_41_29]|uniref:Uncharacterized protein n=1 Tax=Candidatus Yanofskybacteria bacterium RIFCSPHIGHO2_01_FULL_41_53 TaxID=1802663 RepID=A0A1F8EKR8_9BACT|nr:MAG: hypothetical protein A2650_00780 [Candidatus Yanofskybacteria bacterium RIFCSPHIGHO2_01_FULL_41_53]OGN10836.1 MAG: hypothetical protein A3B91_03565 [Candidatus Yanofskybacteria bacterium RIFCSPHIGHO2_02_FULL_41_29]OGN18552.1 MAG: hypothetical protein A3F48_01250 [Candidatus Yanofskybacteria bacterium RIFCSPHIGHO2_12_FULL_41_9]OGN24500.1 MAG: hypothetical protein A2916_02615 [Candidatus Yanofskybacteria bacterium RIFCSPLOWO2_01_FULL_41_67]OGN29505.1 MAG: hypothetical protein A3H54_01205 
MDRLVAQLGRSKIILVFIVGIGFILGYLNYSGQEKPVILSQEEPTKKDGLDFFKDFSLDLSIFNNETYKKLEIFGENPVYPDFTGERKNPFAPF